MPLLLLDSDVPDNDEAARNITNRLYGGGGEQRLQQEMLLGIGGVRALRLWSRMTGPRTRTSTTPTRATPASSGSSGSTS